MIVLMGERALFTVGSTVIVEYPVDSGKIVLVNEPKKNDSWNVPGGKLDYDYDGTLESLTICAVREVEEECGLLVEITHSLGYDIIADEAKIQFSFVGVAIGGIIRTTSEHPAIIQRTIDEIRNLEQNEGKKLRSEDRVLERIEQYIIGDHKVPINTAYKHRLSDPYPSRSTKPTKKKSGKPPSFYR